MVPEVLNRRYGSIAVMAFQADNGHSIRRPDEKRLRVA